jgi:crotonobetainyl-CoA:carnitine CoA-transferase CaiB-like acyl-CoA transferase
MGTAAQEECDVMAGPLEGLVVVDASRGDAGAIGTVLLADHGATLVVVERPGDARLSAQRRAVWRRNTRSIELDERHPDDQERLRQIALGADVFVESFGPGVAATYGLDYATLSLQAPGLVVASITGYGQSGPWADRPADEALVAARLGLLNEVEGVRIGPKFIANPAIGYSTGFLMAIDVLAALQARTRDGLGQQVNVSLLDGALVQCPMTWWWNERGISFVKREKGSSYGFGRSRIITGSFLCKDDTYVMVHSGGEGGFKTAMTLLEFGDEVRTIVGQPEMSVPLDDREFEIARVLAPAAFAERTRAEWIELFDAADLAVMPVLRPGEVLTDSQVQAAGMTAIVDDAELGAVMQTRPPIVFGRSPAPTPVRAPRSDEHRNELLQRPPRSAFGGGRGVRTSNAPLAGRRILDFSSFFATGYGAKLLCDLGADVIKVEVPVGDQLRAFPDPFEACNRGKRSLAIDLRSATGLDVVRRLVQTSDAVMHNLRPGKAEGLGIGEEQLRAINPDLIYCYLPGFGSVGPRRDQKSFEPLLSGFTGVLHEAAGVADEPVAKAFGNADYYNGLLGATAVLMALHHRDRTGEGQYVESPHLHSSLFVASHNMAMPDGVPLRSDILVDADLMGPDPTRRLFRTHDGWVALGVVDNADVDRLWTVLGLDRLRADERMATAESRRARRSELDAVTEPWFAARPTSEVIDALEAAGLAVEAAREESGIPEFFFTPWALDAGLVFEQDHPAHGPIREVGLVTHLDRTPAVRRGPNALLGAHSRQILAELGLTEGDIDQLIGSGVVLQAEQCA